MSNKRITDVDFVESLNSDESFFINQNNSLKQINKSNIVFDIVNGGTGANNADDARDNLGAASVDSVNDVKSSVTALNNSFNEYTNATNNSITDLNNTIDALLNDEIIISMNGGGTGANNGSDGLKNLLAAGYTILSPYQYGDELPPAGIAGRIFFKRVPLSES